MIEYADYEPLGGYVSITLKLSDLKSLIDNPTEKQAEIKAILERAEQEKRAYSDYANADRKI